MRGLKGLLAFVLLAQLACAAAAPVSTPTAAPTPSVPVDRNAIGRPTAPVLVEEWVDFL